jgi:hypothetical protein
MINTTTQIRDDLLQQLRNFLDQRADYISGNDPFMPSAPNTALQLLRLLDAETDGEFK